LSKSVNPNTINKIVFSSNSSHPDLQNEVDEYELPQIYGGICECKATCIYSEKGPWSEVENQINYKDPKPSSDDDVSEGDGKPYYNMMGLNKKLVNF
jgi:hypothetical protein